MTLPQTPEEKVAFAAQLKEEGNALFKKGDFKGAVQKYNRIFPYIEGLTSTLSSVFQNNLSNGAASQDTKSPLQKQIDELRTTGRSNLTACHLKLGNYDKAIKNASLVLQGDANNAKALFRRGQAYLAKKDLDKAKKDLEAAQKLAPNDGLINAELAKLQQSYVEHEKKEKSLYAKMFAKMQQE